MDYLEFIARVTSHIPDKGQVMIRYYGLYSNAHRGKMRRAGADPPHPPIMSSRNSCWQLRRVESIFRASVTAFIVYSMGESILNLLILRNRVNCVAV